MGIGFRGFGVSGSRDFVSSQPRDLATTYPRDLVLLICLFIKPRLFEV